MTEAQGRSDTPALMLASQGSVAARIAASASLALLRMRKMAWMIGSRHHWALLRKGVGPSIEHRPLLRGRRYATILDVGANIGQFTLWAGEEMRPDVIVAVEPQSSAVTVLRMVSDVVACDVHIRQAAWGSKPGRADLNVTRAADSSSLLAPLSEGARHLEVVGHETITVERGEDALAELGPLPRPALLKIDVQGTELDVLKGLGSALRVVDGVVVEVSVGSSYLGQSSIGDLFTFLAEEGFVSVGASRVPGTGASVIEQLDVLFERAAR